MGLHLLEREKRVLKDIDNPEPKFQGHEYLLECYLKPRARINILDALKENDIHPTSMIDLSDGLASDLRQICRSSQCGARIYLERIPIARQTTELAEEMHIDPVIAALNGGEDHELLFTVPLDMQEKIMQRYADLKLSLKHKDSLLKMVDADNMKTNLFDFTKAADEEGAGWIFYKNQDAINDIKNAFPNMITRNEAIMNYAINIGDLQIEGKDISGKKRKEMAQEVIKSFQSKEINTAVKQEKVNTLKEIKEGDKIGRFKVVGVREK
jgi:hypothetical protein